MNDSMVRGAWERSRERAARFRFTILLVVFSAYPVALIVAPPGGVRYAAIDLVLMALYVANWPERRRTRFLMLTAAAALSCVLLVVSWLTTGSGPFAGSYAPLMVRTILIFGFTAAIAVTTLLHVLERERVTADVVLGAIAVYLFLGAMWAVLYDLAGLVQPDSFRAVTDIGSGATLATAGPLTLPDSIYFSYSTLTTAGFGDIAPTARSTRTLAWMEAATGQIYLVVLVARLVSLELAHSDRSR